MRPIAFKEFEIFEGNKGLTTPCYLTDFSINDTPYLIAWKPNNK